MRAMLITAIRGYVRLGLIGCGLPKADPEWKARLHQLVPSIAWARYLPQIARNPAAKLVAVCDIVEERARMVLEAYRAQELYTDYEEMLKKADIEAVIVASPHLLHAPMVIAAAKAAKHVLVEKPMATKFEDADKMLKEARKAGVKLMALGSLHTEAFFEAKQLIDDGLLGKICLVRVRFSHYGPGHSEWFYKEGGGPLLDLGVYAVSIATELLGPAKRVQAFCGTAIEERTVGSKTVRIETEDNAVVSLDFGDGKLASIETNYCTLPGIDLGSITEIHGSLGSVFLERWDQCLRIYTEKEMYPRLSGWFQKEYAGLLDLGAGAEVSHFVECILQDKEPRYTGEHQRHVVEILEKARESAKTGQALKLTSSF